ncbi:MAG: sugar nucleotide-binding protein, partial [Candidatus Sabulitectum sp.]|nr:sugar nucleotide-binding protein [Candidatus Sabulitectum sp.]
MRELFLTGATGRLGRTVQIEFKDSWVIHPCCGSRGEDLTTLDPVDTVPEQTDFVLNCAALSSRGGCIKNPVTAFKLNTLWPQKLATFCGETNRRLVHISTDLVYAGGIPPYTEKSPAIPRSLYGWTKLLGDIAVQRINPNACIVRTSILVGNAGAKMTTFSEDILSGTATHFHVDCFRNHTDINALARFLSNCLYSSRSGLILAAAPYAMSRAAYAYSLLQRDI